MAAGTIRRIVVRGRVQGVGYRAWVADHAVAQNLEGWVRNRRDGSVEAVFAGDAARVAALIAQCRRGPSSARVIGVDDEAASLDQLNLRNPGEEFSVLPTV